MSRKSNILSKTLYIGLLTIWLIALTIVADLLIFPAIDRAICYPKLAKSLGLESNDQSILHDIREYLNIELVQGLSPEEVHAKLGKIANIAIYRYEEAPRGEHQFEIITLKTCLITVNDIRISVTYSNDWKFLGFSLLTDD
jgi:hypothetical protein